jgi:Rod binding domain-containing protein
MSTPLIPPVSLLNSGASVNAPANTRDPDRAHDAAQQFEALLIGQMLHSVRQGGSGWLGSEDSSGECATDYAEQQFAAVLAQNGGLGLADLITKGLEK